MVVGDELKGIISMRDLMALAHLRPADEPPGLAPAGLKGVVVAETALGDVRGTEGFYHYRQYAAPDLAATRTFEDVVHLLIDGDLPTLAERAAVAAELAPLRHLPPDVLAALPAIASSVTTPVAALRTAISLLAGAEGFAASLDLDHAQLRADALRLTAAVPTLIAALHRLRSGDEPIAPRDDLAYAANYLYMVEGTEPDPVRARAIEQYLILGIDHGFNASTFVARAVTSTGADLGAVVVAALGSLSGPLHGGAPSRALDTLDEIGSPDRAEEWVRTAVARGDRIMGFGHPVYRTADPRSVMLRSIAEGIGGELVEFAEAGRDGRGGHAGRAQARPRAAHQRRVVRRRRHGPLRPPPRPLHARPSRPAGSSAGAPTRSSSTRTTASSARAAATSAPRRPSPSPNPDPEGRA